MVVAGAKDDEHRERIERLGLRSFLVVPMIGRTGPVGALTLATAESGRLYSVSDVGFANTLADRAATAVENARLALALERMVASERRAREIVERMESAIAAMSRATTRAEVAEAACRIGGEAMGAHAAHIWLEQADGSFALAATWPAGESLVEGFRTIAADADAPAARVARTGQAEWIESEEGFERAAPAIYPLVKAAGRMSAFGVLPIRTVRRFKGVLSVSHHLPHTYDADERAFYASLTEHCAQSLERARLFEEEQAARDVLEKAGRAKDEFLATISHELRTPLSSILGWTTLLRGRPRDEAKLEHGLEVIDRNARTQERLIGDLLDVARIVSGKLRLDLTRTALWEVVHAAAEIVRPAADGKGVRLSLDVDPDLPALVADPARLQQVVWNLLINAVRFTPPGGTVTVDARRTNSTILLHVRDTGSGIPPQHLPHLFEPFRQVDGSATRRHGGLGLGLAIVRHVVEAHGGSVEAHSDGAGRGATFTVALPVRAIDDSCGSERPEPPEERPPPVPRARLDGVRVLVVEDDADALDLIRNVLGDAGARVTAVASAAAALNADGPFDVIVSDIGMPEMDGYALMKRIRSRATGGDVPAIALTAFARPQDAERARRAGYQEHLHKPVEPGKLLATIANWRPARAAHRS
jgi:signal transduction histidine kinase/ActR/RegA family two-component response regulator